jgi:ATP-dependent DNA ligase
MMVCQYFSGICRASLRSILLSCDGHDVRTERLTDRKQELRRLLAKTSPPLPLRFADHVEGTGVALFELVCELHLEGL